MAGAMVMLPPGTTNSAVLRSAVERPPGDWGYDELEWTVNLLRQHLARWDGRWWSDRTVRRQLHPLGYVWKRPRYVLQPDRYRARKMRRIRQRVKDLEPRAVLLFEDETDLLLFPPLRACSAHRGKSAKVVISGRNARRVLFGAINVRTGHRLLLPRRYQKGEDFREFLLLIHDHYRGWPVWLLLDEDSSHTAHGSVGLARELGIGLLWLPKHCPELNAMDHVWGHAKDEVCANHQEPAIEHLVDRFIRYIQGLSLGRPNGRPVYYRRTSGSGKNVKISLSTCLEQDLAAINLNRTAVGFGAGETTFGWRFYPRIQTPPTQSNPRRILGILVNNGPGPDYAANNLRLEPGPRECYALMVVPNFVPMIKMTTITNWFDLKTCHPDQMLDTNDMLSLGRKLQTARNAYHRLCDSGRYRPTDIESLGERLDQLEAMLPIQSHQVTLPFEGDLTGSEIFSSSTAGLAPRLLTWYGEPARPGGSIFIMGSGFNVRDMKVIVGGVTLKDVNAVPTPGVPVQAPTLGSPQSPSFDLISRNVLRIDMPKNAKSIRTAVVYHDSTFVCFDQGRGKDENGTCDDCASLKERAKKAQAADGKAKGGDRADRMRAEAAMGVRRPRRHLQRDLESPVRRGPLRWHGRPGGSETRVNHRDHDVQDQSRGRLDDDDHVVRDHAAGRRPAARDLSAHGREPPAGRDPGRAGAGHGQRHHSGLPARYRAEHLVSAAPRRQARRSGRRPECRD